MKSYLILLAAISEIKETGESIKFMKFVHTMTGASFLVLGVSVLKYGSQLETTVTHSINIKSMLSESLEGLDIRILTITIMLSLVFLCRTLLDFMFAFSLLHSDRKNFLIVLIVIIFTEVVTSVALVSMMKKSNKSMEKTQ